MGAKGIGHEGHPDGVAGCGLKGCGVVQDEVVALHGSESHMGPREHTSEPGAQKRSSEWGRRSRRGR